MTCNKLWLTLGGCAALAAALIAPPLLSSSLQAAPVKKSAARKSVPPSRPGTCSFTLVTSISTRLVDGPSNRPVRGSGSAAEMANGVYSVSYSQIPAVDQSRRGDRVMTCLVKLPADCPPGDDRGKLYTVTNMRTEHSWTLYDSEHLCGGA